LCCVLCYDYHFVTHVTHVVGCVHEQEAKDDEPV